MISYDNYTLEERQQITEAIAKYDAHPVFLPQEILKDSLHYYDTVITPIFHNFVSYKYDNSLKNLKLLKAYKEMNRIFAEATLSLYKQCPHATILFNDPYFLLVPKFLSENESPNMGFFFHSPFPSYEIYRVLLPAQEVLESLLCCDIVGFQVYEYARHFFTCCHRLLGLEAKARHGGMIGIIYKGRDIIIRVVHTGISKEYTEGLMNTREFKKELEQLKKIIRNRVVIASVDKLSPISGIKNKLIAYKNLLHDYPHYFGNILLIQYCTPGNTCVYTKQASEEIKDLVNEIEHEFPTSIIYCEMWVSNEKRLALLTVAEVLLVTSLRDGFCLLPFEFLVAKGANVTECSSIGSTILSEFAGCASAMSSICRVNPYVISDITYSILNTLESQFVLARYTSFQHDLEYIAKHDASNWLNSLIRDIKYGHNNNETSLYLGAIDNKILRAGRFFEYLMSSDIQSCYSKATNRVILLDSEGTLIPPVSQAVIQTSNIISSELKDFLTKLCSDERNSVYILSGKTKHLMNKWFGDIPKLGLAAEFGYHYRKNTDNEWKIAPAQQTNGWKEKAHEIFLWYKERTDGTEIEIKDGSIVWLYKEADPELGKWQAKELEKTLKVALADYPEVTTILGRGFVEVKLGKIEKGEFGYLVFEKIKRCKGDIDFVLCMGDDTSDEPMFLLVNSLYPMDDGMKGHSVFTCTVGRKPSHARYYVNDYKDTLAILELLVTYQSKMELESYNEQNMPQEDIGTFHSTPLVTPLTVLTDLLLRRTKEGGQVFV